MRLPATLAAAALTPLALARDLTSTALRLDAQERAADSTGIGGHDGKFFVNSGDKAFRLNIGGQLQFRYNTTFRDDPGPGPDDDLSVGFHTRRTRLEFTGHIYEKWNFKVVGGFSRSTGLFILEDAILSYKFGNDVTVTWGQFKLPILREESLSSKYQLAADRSVANEAFNQDRSQGVQVHWQGEQVRLFAVISDGIRAVNTAYNAPAEADIALTARAELRLGQAGWKKYDDFTSFRGDDRGALIGAALHWQSAGETNPSAAGSTDTLLYTVDAAWEGGGWNLFAAFIGRLVDAPGGSDLSDFGAVAQGGVFVCDHTELFARWDAVFPDSDQAAHDDFHTVAVGANHYFIPESHTAKLTIDVQWFLDDQASSSSLVSVNEGIGLLADTGDDQVTLRIQMQLLF
ncbi:MAG: hypothetical protein DYG94_01640 [Leptolyngbya sp. PLA3]|nr:MAG: hypothetical protein EDM82_00245 [Cyanobacteria bacterium CYA]MCE7967434.1 hypothetical protein [Leptolyngbya sp. PL-A3]